MIDKEEWKKAGTGIFISFSCRDNSSFKHNSLLCLWQCFFACHETCETYLNTKERYIDSNKWMCFVTAKNTWGEAVKVCEGAEVSFENLTRVAP